MRIFNPDDEKEVIKFDGIEYDIPPGWSDLSPAVALHAEAVLGKWGVATAKETLSPSEVEKLAKAKWTSSNREWAEEVVIDFHNQTKDKVAAGLKVEEPETVKKAKALLKVL